MRDSHITRKVNAYYVSNTNSKQGLRKGNVMILKELKEIIKDWPDDARVAIYSEEGVHLPNVFVKDVILEDYEGLGMIVDFTI